MLTVRSWLPPEVRPTVPGRRPSGRADRSSVAESSRRCGSLVARGGNGPCRGWRSGHAVIEQCRDDPSRCGLAHFGAGHEVPCVTAGQSAPLSLAAGAVLLATTEADNVKVSHPVQGTQCAFIKHPGIWPPITALAAPTSGPRSAARLGGSGSPEQAMGVSAEAMGVSAEGRRNATGHARPAPCHPG